MLKKTLYAIAVLALAVGGALSQDKGGKGGGKGGAPKGPGLGLSSPDFQDGGIIPDKYTQAVPMPVSPTLEWTNVPMNTESFALIMHDPDAAVNKSADDILHWMAFNIPGTARSLPGGMSDAATLPDGTIQAKNLRGTPGFMGPGNGAINPYHHYTWELYALDTKLSLGPDATRVEVVEAMKGHVIGKAVLNGRFKRSQ
jgi:Raf kinase inhibitor-like YbhB/YbcL family protein